MAISNRYEETLNDFIDNSNLESSDQSGLIDEGSRNLPSLQAVQQNC